MGLAVSVLGFGVFCQLAHMLPAEDQLRIVASRGDKIVPIERCPAVTVCAKSFYKSQTPKMQECMYNEGLPLVWGLGFRVQVGSEGLEQHPLVAPVDFCTVI